VLAIASGQPAPDMPTIVMLSVPEVFSVRPVDPSTLLASQLSKVLMGSQPITSGIVCPIASRHHARQYELERCKIGKTNGPTLMATGSSNMKLASRFKR